MLVVGIACIGAITAGVAAWLVAQVEADPRAESPRREPLTRRRDASESDPKQGARGHVLPPGRSAGWADVRNEFGRRQPQRHRMHVFVVRLARCLAIDPQDPHHPYGTSAVTTGLRFSLEKPNPAAPASSGVASGCLTAVKNSGTPHL